MGMYSKYSNWTKDKTKEHIDTSVDNAKTEIEEDITPLVGEVIASDPTIISEVTTKLDLSKNTTFQDLVNVVDQVNTLAQTARDTASNVNRTTKVLIITTDTIQSTLDTISAQQATDEATINAVTNTVNSVKNTVQSVQASVDSQGEIIGALRNNVQAVTDSVAGLEYLKDATADLTDSVDSITDALGDENTGLVKTVNDTIDNLSNLTDTVENMDEQLQERVDNYISQNQEITTIQSNLTTVQGNITTINSNIDEANSKINTTNTKLSQAEEAISAAETNITQANEKITAAQETLGTVQESIDAAEEAIESANTEIGVAKNNAQLAQQAADAAQGDADIALSAAGTAQTKADAADTKAQSAITEIGFEGEYNPETGEIEVTGVGIKGNITTIQGNAIALTNLTNSIKETADGLVTTTQALGETTSALQTTTQGLQSSITAIQSQQATDEATIASVSDVANAAKSGVEALSGLSDSVSAIEHALNDKTSEGDPADGLVQVVSDLGTNLNNLNTTVTNIDENLKTRVDGYISQNTELLTIKENVESQASSITSINSTLDDIDDTLTTVNSSISDVNTALDAAESDINTAKERLTTAETNIQTAQSDADAAKTAANTASSNASTALTNAQQAASTANQALSEVQSKSTTHYGNTAPSNPSLGDCWFDTANNCLKQYDGSNWADIGNSVVSKVVDATYINAMNIQSTKIAINNSQGNRIFLADGHTGKEKVQIGGFTVDENSIKTSSKDPQYELRKARYYGTYYTKVFSERHRYDYSDNGEELTHIGFYDSLSVVNNLWMCIHFNRAYSGFKIRVALEIEEPEIDSSIPQVTKPYENFICVFSGLNKLPAANSSVSDISTALNYKDQADFTTYGTTQDINNLSSYREFTYNVRAGQDIVIWAYKKNSNYYRNHIVLQLPIDTAAASQITISPKEISLGQHCSITDRGYLKASTGKIGNFTLVNDNLTLNEETFNVPGKLLVGSDGIILGQNNEFMVTPDGEATITKGKFGPWTLDEQGLNSKDLSLTTSRITLKDTLNLVAKSGSNAEGIIKTINGKLSLKNSSEQAQILLRDTDTSSRIIRKIKVSYSSNNIYINILDNNNDPAFLARDYVFTYYVGGFNWGSTYRSYSINLTTDKNSWTIPNNDFFTIFGVNVNNSSNWKAEAFKTIYQIQSYKGNVVVKGDLLPYNDSDSLGTSLNPWANLYVGTIHANTVDTSSTISGSGAGSGSSSGGSSSSGGGCFDAGTQILMSDGSTKNIEDVVKDDIVKSYDVNTNTFKDLKVIGLFERQQDRNLVRLEFEDGTILNTTCTHLFYTTEGWVALDPTYPYSFEETDEEQYVQLMEKGQYFYKIENNEMVTTKLLSIKYKHGVSLEHKVYNLDVEGHSTFFSENILGHNKKVILP